MRIVLAGHQPCQVQGRGVEALVESAVEDLGMGFWFGGKRGVVQEAYLLATMNFRLSHPQLPFWQISHLLSRRPPPCGRSTRAFLIPGEGWCIIHSHSRVWGWARTAVLRERCSIDGSQRD